VDQHCLCISGIDRVSLATHSDHEGEIIMQKIIVKVTQRDLNRGIGYDCLACPVALALHRRTKRTWSVGRFRGVEVSTPPTWRFIHLPESVTRFVTRFDAASKLGRKKLKPFQFTARIQESPKGGKR